MLRDVDTRTSERPRTRPTSEGTPAAAGTGAKPRWRTQLPHAVRPTGSENCPARSRLRSAARQLPTCAWSRASRKPKSAQTRSASAVRCRPSFPDRMDAIWHSADGRLKLRSIWCCASLRESVTPRNQHVQHHLWGKGSASPVRAEPAGRACMRGFLPAITGHLESSASLQRALCVELRRLSRRCGAVATGKGGTVHSRCHGMGFTAMLARRLAGLGPASRAAAPVPPLPSIGPGRVCPVSRTSRREKMACSTQCLTPSPHHGRVLGCSVSGSHARSGPQPRLPWRMMAFRNGPCRPWEEGIPDPPEQDRAWSLARPRTEGRIRDFATGTRSRGAVRATEHCFPRIPVACNLSTCAGLIRRARTIHAFSWRWDPSSLVQRPCSPAVAGSDRAVGLRSGSGGSRIARQRGFGLS